MAFLIAELQLRSEMFWITMWESSPARPITAAAETAIAVIFRMRFRP